MCYKRKVAAVVVTYNRVELLKRAIDALLAQSVELEHIVVVNNNSSDATKDYLDSNQNKKIMPIHLSTNTGGAGGFSAGISFAHGLGVDYIWIMDDDAIPDINALSELLLADEHLEKKHIESGFLCSHVVSDDNICMNVPGISKKTNETGYLDWPAFASVGIVGVDKATFVSVLFRRNVISEVGLPVKEMFIWGDDTEYTWRISKRYKCYYVANSIVNHKRVLAKSLSLSVEESISRIPWYGFLYRNSFYNIRKHGNIKEFLSYLNHVSKDFISILLHSKKYKMKKLYTLFHGVLSGLLFNPKIDYPKK